MKAGFAKISITPTIGTRMLGWADRDQAGGCTSIHDPVHLRALYIEHNGERALILSYDLCFVGRAEADQIKGAIGRVHDLLPRQIMVSATHNHAGPALGSWGGALPNQQYMEDVILATRIAVKTARRTARSVSVHAGSGKTALPLSRRKFIDGVMHNAPNHAGAVCDVLPVCQLLDNAGEPVCILFSCAAHPVIVRNHQISAEYPGLACDLIDNFAGKECGLFLQGAAGDARPSIITRGDRWNWNSGYEEMQTAAKMIANETIDVIKYGLNLVQPALRIELHEMDWQLSAGPTREKLEEVHEAKESTPDDEVRRRWAERQLGILTRHGQLADSCPVLIQFVQLGARLHLIATEGEPVSDHGLHMLRAFPGVTFPLGYANGEAAYLPSSRMLSEGGYEVDSFWEYGLPSRFAPGMEDQLQKAFDKFIANAPARETAPSAARMNLASTRPVQAV